MRINTPPPTNLNMSLNFGATSYPCAASLATGALLRESGGTIAGFVGSAAGSIPSWLAASSAFLDSIRAWAIGATSVPGAALINTTAAAAGAQQYSPALDMGGRGWKTDATAASQAVLFRREVRPVQGAAAPTGNLVDSVSINAGAHTDLSTLSSAGVLSLLAGCTVGAAALTTTGIALSGALALATTPTEAKGLVLRNTTAATSGTAQASPGFYLSGNSYHAAASHQYTWRQHIAGSGTYDVSIWTLSFQQDGGGWTDAMTIANSGRMWFWWTGKYDGGLRVKADDGGESGYLSFAGPTLISPASQAMTSANGPAGYSTEPIWLKIYIGTVAHIVAAYPVV